jgi:hypothetical protein
METKISNEAEIGNLQQGAVMPCFIRSLENLEGEEWMDCLGYDGIYSISNYGRIKSERRYDSAGRLIKEKILKQTISAKGIPSVKFSVNGVATTKEPLRLVGECFIGEKKDDEEYCHKNKNPLDNRLKNIIITKRSISKEICYKLGIQSDWGIGENSKKVKELRAKEFDIFEDGILKRRICSCCFKELDINLFYHTSKSGLYRNDCKDCVKKHLGVIDVGKLIYRKELAKAGLRYCSCCKELKRLDSDFGKAKNNYMGKSNNCKACVNGKNAKYRLKNKA